jgi:uncharacterized protein
MTAEISFQDWSDFLIRNSAVCGPAELHGMLCGTLCSGESIESEAWVDKAFAFLDVLEGTDDQELRGALAAFFDLGSSALAEQTYTLQPLLPDDALPLTDRSGALADWCQGFLFGFGSVEGIAEKLDEDAKDALQDFAHISQLDPAETTAEDEDLYVELVEYVRLAVFDMYAQLNPERASGDSSTTMH